MRDLGFVIGSSSDPQMQARVRQVAQEQNLSPDYAWVFVVDQILTGLMEEADQAALNEIISVASERHVRLANPCLTFQTWQAGSGEAYPILHFLSGEIRDRSSNEPVMMTREIAQTISQSLGLIFRTDSVQVMLPDASSGPS
jgi:hypothetical protein